MTDPHRLLDDGCDEVTAALLNAGRVYEPPPEMKQQTLAALGVAGGALGISKTAGAAKSAALAAAGRPWYLTGGGILSGVALLAVGGALLLGLARQRSLPRASSEIAAPSASVEVVPQAAPPSAEPGTAPIAGSDIDTVTSSRANKRIESGTTSPAPSIASAASSSSASPGGSSAPAPSSLSMELSMLDSAGAALRAGNGARALQILDDYARAFPHGAMQLEATVLRIEALAQSGNRAAASRLANEFLQRRPNSVMAARVRAYADPMPADAGAPPVAGSSKAPADQGRQLP